MINKLMLHADSTDDAMDGFKADTAAFIDAWVESGEGTLTDDERRAFEEWDYGALYAMGGHPYVLWQFIRGVYVPDTMPVSDLAAAFKEATTPHGYPDYST